METKMFAGRCGGCGVHLSVDTVECQECGWRDKTHRATQRAHANESQRTALQEAIARRHAEAEAAATREAYDRMPELRRRDDESQEEWVNRVRAIGRTYWRRIHGNA